MLLLRLPKGVECVAETLLSERDMSINQVRIRARLALKHVIQLSGELLRRPDIAGVGQYHGRREQHALVCPEGRGFASGGGSTGPIADRVKRLCKSHVFRRRLTRTPGRLVGLASFT